MWFNSEWSYRKRITIQNPNQYFIPYAQIYIQLNYSDISSYVQQNLQDLVFVDNERTLQNGQYITIPTQLYFYIHYIDTTNKVAGIFIKVPNIDANSNKVIYMYFGNPNATQSPYMDPNQTFDYYINFSEIAQQQNWQTALDSQMEIYDIRNNQVVTFENNTLSPFVTLDTNSETLEISSSIDIAVIPKGLKFGRLHRFLSLAKSLTPTGTLFGVTWFSKANGFYTSSESVLQTTNNIKLKHIANGVESNPITITYAPNTNIFNFVDLTLTSNKVIGSIDNQNSLESNQSVSIQSVVNRTDFNFGLYNYGLTLSQPTNLYKSTTQINDLNYSQSGNYGIAVGNNGVALLFNSNGYSSLNTGVTVNLNSVLIDGSNVVIVGEDGTILFSSNSGSSFTKLNSGVSYGLNKVTKIGNMYYVVGDQGTILTINPSNNSITSAATTGNSNIDLYDIAGDGNQKLISVGTNGNIIFSDNGGNVWSSKNIYTDNLTSIAYLGNNSFIIGTYNTILRSTDNGTSFNVVPVSRFKGYLKKLVQIQNSNVVYGITDLGYVVYAYTNNLVPYEVSLNTTIPGTAFSMFSPNQVWFYDGTNLQIVTLYSSTAQYHNLIAMVAYDKELVATVSSTIENSDFPINSLKLLQSAYLTEPQTKYIGTALFDSSDNKLKLWNGSEWIETGLKILSPEEQGILATWAAGESLSLGRTKMVNISGEFDIDLQSIQIDQNATISKPAIYNIKWLIYTMKPPPVIPISNIQGTFSDLSRTINYTVDNNSPETMIPTTNINFTLGSPTANVTVTITDPSVLESVVNITRGENSQNVSISIRPKVNPGYSGIKNSTVFIRVTQYSYQTLNLPLNFSVQYVSYDTGTDHYQVDYNTNSIVAIRRVQPIIINFVPNLPVQQISNIGVAYIGCCFDYALEISPTQTSGTFDITKVCYEIARSNDSGQFLINNVLSSTYTPTVGLPIVINEGVVDSPFLFIDINLYYFGAVAPKYITYEGSNDGGIGYGMVTYNENIGFQNLGYARLIASDRRFFRQNGTVAVTRIV